MMLPMPLFFEPFLLLGKDTPLAPPGYEVPTPRTVLTTT